MSTIKQKKAAKRMAENLTGERKETAQEMLENAGYGKGVAKTPSRVLESPGVQEELRKLGFNPEDAKMVVAEVLSTGNNREKLAAADEIFKVTGQYRQSEFNAFAHDERTDDELDEEIRGLHKEARASRMPPEALAEAERLQDELEKLDEKFGVPI